MYIFSIELYCMFLKDDKIMVFLITQKKIKVFKKIKILENNLYT